MLYASIKLFNWFLRILIAITCNGIKSEHVATPPEILALRYYTLYAVMPVNVSV